MPTLCLIKFLAIPLNVVTRVNGYTVYTTHPFIYVTQTLKDTIEVCTSRTDENGFFTIIRYVYVTIIFLSQFFIADCFFNIYPFIMNCSWLQVVVLKTYETLCSMYLSLRNQMTLVSIWLRMR